MATERIIAPSLRSEPVSIVNGLTVDVEDYFHTEALAGAVSSEEWDSLESRVERNTCRVLEILDRHRMRATFSYWAG
jgi:hypothetical protein